jgi:hypothetical protein
MDVPVAIVVGEVLDEVKSRDELAGCEVVSLVDCFGRERAMSETAECIAAGVTELLERA